MNKDYDDDYATLMKTNLNLCDRHTCSNTSIPNTLRQSPNFYENLQTGAYENTILGAVLLTVGWSYVGNYVTPSTLLDRACACSYKNLPKYRSYRVSNTTI